MNIEPVDLGFIEVIHAADLTDAHVGRPVSFPHREGRVHGTLARLSPMVGGDMDLVLARHTYTVDADTPVSVVLKTAAEIAKERLS